MDTNGFCILLELSGHHLPSWMSLWWECQFLCPCQYELNLLIADSYYCSRTVVWSTVNSIGIVGHWRVKLLKKAGFIWLSELSFLGLACLLKMIEDMTVAASLADSFAFAAGWLVRVGFATEETSFSCLFLFIVASLLTVWARGLAFCRSLWVTTSCNPVAYYY